MSAPSRLQGTDGVRAETLVAMNPRVRGLTPLEAFRQERVITEEFMELYAYAVVRWLVEAGAMVEGEEVVVGWDPRDPEGSFTNGAVRGIRRAGATCVVVGMLPTPAAALSMLYRGAAAALVVTASHNPKDQNGIKLFLSPGALKPLPADDVAITAAAEGVSFSALRRSPFRGHVINARAEARAVYLGFLSDPANSWVGPDQSFDGLIVVVDAANGAVAPLAEPALRRSGVREVHLVGAELSGDVNRGCGVAELEGCAWVDRRGRTNVGGSLADHPLVEALFRLGERHRLELASGVTELVGMAFDADGDRVYLLYYDFVEDVVWVLDGDVLAAHQAAYLAERSPKLMNRAHFVNTVESDTQAARYAASLGYLPHCTGVGDKWVLLWVVSSFLERALDRGKAHLQFSSLEQRVGHLKGAACQEGSALVPSEERIIWQKELPRLHALVGLEGSGVGCEASGHLLTAGLLATRRGVLLPAFVGNGLKSGLNSLVAMRWLRQKLSEREYVERLRHPFAPGWRRSFTVYYTDKSLLARGTPFWRELEQLAVQECRSRFPEQFNVKLNFFPEEPNMLYVGVRDASSQMYASVFCRNSGTEEKTGVTLSGVTEGALHLEPLGEVLHRFLLSQMKDPDHPYAHAERKLIALLRREGKVGLERVRRLVPRVEAEKLLAEGIKQGFLEKDGGVYRLSSVGRRYAVELRKAGQRGS